MRYEFLLCDVFTRERFGGNQLAVFPQAEGLSADLMQRIAREFNFSETTFVLPAESGGDRRVRIFTPKDEVPFAGHPNIGTAFALAKSLAWGEPSEWNGEHGIVFEEAAGDVPISIHATGEGIYCELTAPASLSLGSEVPVPLIAEALTIDPKRILTKTHQPRVVSVGLPFILVELEDLAALEAVLPNVSAFRQIAASGVPPDLHLYVRDQGQFDLRTRMFAPLDGVLEDPATGSANCALVGLLAHLDPDPDADSSWRIAQGVEMGRPSELEARVSKEGGLVTSTRIGGYSAWVGAGELQL